MKILQGFVAATPDGQFLSWYESQTHTGYHVNFAVVADIEDASFSTVPTSRGLSRLAQAKIPAHTWVPAERRVEVILKGYGV